MTLLTQLVDETTAQRGLMAALFAHLVNQTNDSIISVGYSTAATSTPIPNALTSFVADSNSIRVNILWFASLLLSLTTASIAILVKQWLREFLTVTVPSPQARLRLRHLRGPELKKWKVLEICAALPLLLQLALLLFFVGMCYFTASVHRSVEFTTLPLVIG